MNKLTKEEMAVVEAMVLETRRRGNEIVSFWQCKKCCEEDLPQSISVGWTAKGIQVWCVTHDENVQHIDLLGEQVGIVDVKEVAQ